MPLPEFTFENPITDTEDVPTKPSSETEARQIFQGPSNELAALYTNYIKPLVNSLEKIMPRYYIDSGTVNAIAINPNPVFTTYEDMKGIPFFITVMNKNTGAVTLNVNGLGAKSILKNSFDQLQNGDIPQGCIITVIFDGVYFQLESVKRKNPACKLTQTGSLSVANQVDTAIPFTYEDWDTDNIHDNATNNTRLTCQTPGNYLITAKAQIDQSANGIRWIQLIVNGNNIIAWYTTPGHGSTPQLMNITGEWKFNQGDYVELKITQSSGGALNVSAAQLGMVKIPD